MTKEMSDFYKQVKKIEKITDGIYIYGAGMYGKHIYSMLQKEGINVNGYVVTKDAENQKAELPVYNAENVINSNIGLIIGMNRNNSKQVKEYLRKQKFDDKRIVDGGEYLDETNHKEDKTDIPILEITTQIGCKINCKYCPQKLLLNKYYQDDKHRKKSMSLEMFEKCLSKVPLECIISFCGMSEPLLNPQCIDMLEMACESGRKVELFTTLVGGTIEDIKRIIELPLSFVTLHVADKYQYASIPITDEYKEKLEIIVNAKKKDGSSFVNVYNAQTTPDEEIKAILQGNQEVFTTLLDRAGNLEDGNLIGNCILNGKIICTHCGKNLNHNILLPDGTVLLCCMDYGMKHVLGNLLETSYENIINGNQAKYVREGMLEEERKKDILCRRCSLARLSN